MAYDEALASRVRDALAARGVLAEERRMFGGLAFMVSGHMCLGVAATDLMVRVGPERYEDALNLPAARPMDFTGRPMKGFVFIGDKGTGSVEAVDVCLELSLAFVLALPAKPAKPAKPKAARPKPAPRSRAGRRR